LTRLAIAELCTPSAIHGPSVVEIDDGVIQSVGPTRGEVADVLLAPGFIDLQINGVDDIDVWTASNDDWQRLDSLLTSQGVTSWCPTLVTAAQDRYAGRLAELARARARPGARPAMLGAHLEGPFLGSRPGAHAPELIREPDADWLIKLDNGDIALVTIGAEHRAVPRTVRAITDSGIRVSLGHSAPTSAQAEAAFAAGARLVTHLYNAMGHPTAREPGLVGAALMDSDIRVAVIADLVHVHPTMLQIAFALKSGDGVVLVSDSIAWRAGRFDGRPVTVRNGAPRLADGRLAGSCLTIPQAIANVVGRCGVPVEVAITAATTTPAAVLGITDRGRIREGLRADLVALSRQTLQPVATWVRGQQCWGAPFDSQPLSTC
jgi:N-acetylglucosamine-6-phosphate deacetylase